MPAHLADHGTRLVADVNQQLKYCLRGPILDDVRWYFERRRSGARDVGPDDEGGDRERRCVSLSGAAFSRCTGSGSPTARRSSRACHPTSRALGSGAGVIETLVLPHAYSHLAPLVGVA